MVPLIEKICNFMAACCLVFGVDWDEEFLDDEYVIQYRRNEIHVCEL